MLKHFSSPSRRGLGAAAAALALAAIACSFGGGGFPQGPAGAGTVVLNNSSGSDVCFVYISPEVEDSWGEDKLGEEETIGSQTSRTFSGYDPTTTYDLRADNCDHSLFTEVYGVTVADPGYVWDVTALDQTGP